MPTDSRRVSTLLGVLFGLAASGSASAAVALPQIAEAFEVSVGQATWTISLYALLLAVTTAVYGRVSDLVGIRLPLLVGVGLMAGGAIAAAAAPSYGVLLVARAFQGAGAAAVPTLGVAALSSRYDGSVRDLALGRLAGASAVIACLGPLMGGAAEAAAGWRAVLVIPALGVFVLPLVWHVLTADGSGADLDVRGAVLVAGTAAGLVLLLQSPSTGAVVAGVGVLLMLLGAPAIVWHVRRRPGGFLPTEVIGNPIVVRSALAAAAVPAAWFGLLIAAPAVLSADGWEAWQVGLLLVPSALVAAVVPRVTGPLLSRVGSSRALAISAVSASAAMLVAALGAQVDVAAVIAVAVVLVTFAFLLGQPAMSAAVGGAVTSDVRGVALGVATLVFMTGGSIGSAVVGGIGGTWGVPAGLSLLAVLPLVGLAALAPLVRGGRGVQAEVVAGRVGGE
ncbi:MFS transporter [Nocardioides acrostichi]|uniref:MFS transporter n=1 Tax=Nocardioides acrostichi TaxID=2784339 RepID=A0A930YCY6_9ACTN|nr:MFS transporter [Nocardioides acrostichi]MBF4163988.1 MFS transporter [Nocardioides acrostichi]